MKFKAESSLENKSGGLESPKSRKIDMSKFWGRVRNLILAGSTVMVTDQALAQKPENIQPIIVHDENDPRLKAYQDSLEAYTWTVNAVKNIENTKTSPMGALLISTTPNIISNEDMIKKNGQEAFKKNFYFKRTYPKNVYEYDQKGGGAMLIGNYEKPVQAVIYQKPEIKKDTVFSKPPEQRALENKDKNPLPVQESKKKFFSEGDPVYGPNQHIIGFYTSGNNTFTPIPKEFAKDYAMHTEDIDFLYDPKKAESLRTFLRFTIKMENIKIKKLD